MTATMCKRKGLHIPALLKMTWEFIVSGSGELKVRPVFMVTEVFIRSLRVMNYKKPMLPNSIAPMEDINFSKVALKYSSTLTKVTPRPAHALCARKL